MKSKWYELAYNVGYVEQSVIIAAVSKEDAEKQLADIRATGYIKKEVYMSQPLDLEKLTEKKLSGDML